MDNFIHLGIIYIIQNRYQLDATAGYLYSYQNQWMDELYKKNIIFAQFVFSTYLKLSKNKWKIISRFRKESV